MNQPLHQAPLPDAESHDVGLVRLMLDITSQQRLAEPESGLDFIDAVFRHAAQPPEDASRIAAPRL